MCKFVLSNLVPGDIIALRGFTLYSKSIRVVLGSYTNHTAMIVNMHGNIMIGEAVAPKSKFTTLTEYELNMRRGNYIVRVFRVKGATAEESKKASDIFCKKKIGLDYPLSVGRLWIMRFTNSLPWTIKGDWCTRLVWDAWQEAKPNCLVRPPDREHPQGKFKKNPTPRTVENRLVAGVLEDVTDKCITY